MPTQHTQKTPGMRRRAFLRAGLAAGVTLSAWPLSHPPALWGAEAGQPRRGGILRVRGWDPVHFDPQLTRSFKTHTTLSFVYSKLLRHTVGPDVPPGTYIVEPDLAERWETPDDMTYIFHLRQGVKWHKKPPVNGRELVAEDVKFTFDRFLTVEGKPNGICWSPWSGWRWWTAIRCSSCSKSHSSGCSIFWPTLCACGSWPRKWCSTTGT